MLGADGRRKDQARGVGRQERKYDKRTFLNP